MDRRGRRRRHGGGEHRARQPNSFLYRFVPSDPRHLELGGRLQALQVTSRGSGQPIVFHAGRPTPTSSPRTARPAHLRLVFDTRWIALHDTAVDGFAPFDTNALAKARGATPFKRPENGVFRPGSRFSEFVFTETGDTNAQTQAGSDSAASAGSSAEPERAGREHGHLTLRTRRPAHTGLDNLAFLTRDLVRRARTAATRCTRSATRSTRCTLFDSRRHSRARKPLRILARGPRRVRHDRTRPGRTPASRTTATTRSPASTSRRRPAISGLLGAREPKAFKDGGVFWTQQHGDNVTWEIVALDRHHDPHGD
jgi:hypothetical protein